MNTNPLKQIGLTDNEVVVYLHLLKSGSLTAYEIAKQTNVYRAHVYDKLEQLIAKGLVSFVFKQNKKYFSAANPEKIKQYIEDKKKKIALQEKEVEAILPELAAMQNLSKEDTFVEVFNGKQGLKYFMKDIIKTKKEVLITGIDDKKYSEALPVFMEQYFRDLKLNKINERVITIKKKSVFMFDKSLAATTNYRFLEKDEFNLTNTFVYGNKVVIVTWGNPITAVMIRNSNLAKTYRNHFEHLWKISKIKI